MGRGRRSTFDDLATLPWPVALIVGAVGYAGIRHGIPALLAGIDGPAAQIFAGVHGLLSPLAWLWLGACALASLASALRAHRRRRLLDTRTGLDSLAAIGWRDFERLVGEAFRRQGYAVEETGLGGADGGIDLILRKGGQRTLVQCKQWRRQKVPVNVVREMYGLLAHHGAQAVRIATVGGYTQDAARFAAGKPIELIDGATLLAMIRGVQTGHAGVDGPPITDPAPARIEPQFANAAPATSAALDCPRCGAAMIQRNNRRTHSSFWGCPGFPACRGTR
jgi:restriction system protein